MKHLRTLAAAVILSLVAGGLLAAPASAAQYACQSGVLSAFGSGDVARYKVCPERDANTYKWRAHAAVWCDNSSGAAVTCDEIFGDPVVGGLTKNGINHYQFGPHYWSDAVNVHIKTFDTPWSCTGTNLGQYLAYFNNLRAVSRFGEPGTAKSRNSGLTGNMGGCNG